ncbi:hypothetical protein ACF3MZ_14520 [Paenibacillaceae bacterium WGS1546]|uniref:hypothetical protein n=1 Tax=Cohnella sp. WGS1546 TaxID=3366810 RepID=UPI00372CFC43
MKASSVVALCVLLLLCGGIFVKPDKAYACSCAAPPSVKEELNRKTAVFEGKAVDVIVPNKETIDSTVDRVEVRFEVSRAWKGQVDANETVYTAIGSESCGYTDFEAGRTYLVSAYGSPERLETGMCELTKPVDQASAELAELGKGYAPRPAGGAGGGEIDATQAIVSLGLLVPGVFGLLFPYRYSGTRKSDDALTLRTIMLLRGACAAAILIGLWLLLSGLGWM